MSFVAVWSSRITRSAADFIARMRAPAEANWAIELSVMIVAVTFIAFVAGPSSSVNWSPNPLWLPVIIISTQYGLLPGITSAVACTIAASLVRLADPLSQFDYLDAIDQYIREPALWFAAAGILGAFGTRQRARTAALENELKEARVRSERISMAFSDLKASSDEMQRARLCGSAISLQDGLKRLNQTRGSDETAAASLTAVGAELLGGAVVTHMTCRNGRLTVHHTAERLETSPQQHGDAVVAPALMERLQATRRVVTVGNPGDAAFLRGLGDCAAPIFDDRGALVGLLIASEVDASRLELAAELLACLAAFMASSNKVRSAGVTTVRQQRHEVA